MISLGFEPVDEIHDRAIERTEAMWHTRRYDDHVFRAHATTLSAAVRTRLARAGVQTRQVGRGRAFERTAGDQRSGSLDNLINLGDAVVNERGRLRLRPSKHREGRLTTRHL